MSCLTILREQITLIDMPIGFSDSQTPDRLCDKAARRFSPVSALPFFPFRAERRFTKPITLRDVMPMWSSLIRSFLNRLGELCPRFARAWILFTKLIPTFLSGNHILRWCLQLWKVMNHWRFLKETQEGKEERLSIIQQSCSSMVWRLVVGHCKYQA